MVRILHIETVSPAPLKRRFMTSPQLTVLDVCETNGLEPTSLCMPCHKPVYTIDVGYLHDMNHNSEAPAIDTLIIALGSVLGDLGRHVHRRSAVRLHPLQPQ